jgi:peptide deformylase
MKKVFAFLFLLSFCTGIFTQTSIVLSFEINQNGSQLQLDSVLIENTSNSTDTMISYPETELEIDMLSGIESNFAVSNSLKVMQNYPNPFNVKTFIEVYNTEKELSVNIHDISGKQILKEKFKTEIGINTFVFTPGADSQYVVSFNNGKSEQSIKMLHNGNVKSKCNIVMSSSNTMIDKSFKETGFSFTESENLNFTSYTTACFESEIAIASGSPIEDEIYTFDYTGLTDIQPDRPERIPANVTEVSISWNWTSIDDAMGYKYNTTNDYETATDLGTTTELDLNDLSAGLNYHLYVWAYNDCGVSFSLHIIEATTTLVLTQDEIDLINSGTVGEDFEVMDICEQPDSIILRSQSINVNLDEEDLQLLTDRMKITVAGEGVGIAAPQIGINRNVIWVQRYDKGSVYIKPWEVYFNPVITAYSDTVALRNDGCLSVSENCVSEYGIAGNSYRALWVDVQYYDIDGNFVQERINHQYTAHIFQHEIDHLNGIMYFDRQVEEIPEKYIIVEGESYDGLPRID